MSSGPASRKLNPRAAVVELQRAHAEIEKHGVGAVPAARGERLAELGERACAEANALGEAVESFAPRSRARRGRDRAPRACVSGAASSKRRRMTAEPDRGIDETGTRPGAQPPHHLPHHHRHVPDTGRRPPARCPSPSLAIGGSSPRFAAALAAVTPRLLALAAGERVRCSRRVQLQIEAREERPRRRGLLLVLARTACCHTCPGPRCGTCRRHP